LSLLALFWGREVNIWRAMAIAFVLMLLVNPYFLAYDVGFLLSFSAIIGILFFSNFMEKYSIKIDKKEQTIKRKSKEISQKILKEYITPTL
jgi:competence protein ComEC